MVNSWTGEWFAEKDYSIFDAKEMCNMDKIAMVVIDIIKDTDYKIKTTIENICYMILIHLEDDDGSIEDSKFEYDNVKDTIIMNGGLKEFDYDC